jgi:hypothetical protein
LTYLVECDVPKGTRIRKYSGPHLGRAKYSLDEGYEDHAASWMYRDIGEYDSGFKKCVAGTLKYKEKTYVDEMVRPKKTTYRYIEYVDARDVGEKIKFMGGGGI